MHLPDGFMPSSESSGSFRGARGACSRQRGAVFYKTKRISAASRRGALIVLIRIRCNENMGSGGEVLRPYRLHQDVVFAVEKMRPGVLVKRLHILPCR